MRVTVRARFMAVRSPRRMAIVAYCMVNELATRMTVRIAGRGNGSTSKPCGGHTWAWPRKVK